MMHAKKRLVDLIVSRGSTPRVDPVTLAGGAQTHVYLDIPYVLRDAYGLEAASSALAAHLLENGWLTRATMVGGPAMGAYPLAIALAANVGYLRWFGVRAALKDHGVHSWFVGASPTEEDHVILVDDVASTGISLVKAYDRLVSTGAHVLAIVPLVDRGDDAEGTLLGNNIKVPYAPLLTYKDLRIEPLVTL